MIVDSHPTDVFESQPDHALFCLNPRKDDSCLRSSPLKEKTIQHLCYWNSHHNPDLITPDGQLPGNRYIANRGVTKQKTEASATTQSLLDMDDASDSQKEAEPLEPITSRQERYFLSED